MKWEILTREMEEENARNYASDIAGTLRALAAQQAVLYTLTPVIAGMAEGGA